MINIIVIDIVKVANIPVDLSILSTVREQDQIVILQVTVIMLQDHDLVLLPKKREDLINQRLHIATDLVRVDPVADQIPEKELDNKVMDYPLKVNSFQLTRAVILDQIWGSMARRKGKWKKVRS